MGTSVGGGVGGGVGVAGLLVVASHGILNLVHKSGHDGQLYVFGLEIENKVVDKRVGKFDSCRQ